MKMKVQKNATAIKMCLRQTMMITSVTRQVVHTCNRQARSDFAVCMLTGV